MVNLAPRRMVQNVPFDGKPPRDRGQRASASDRFCIRETGSRVTAARNARSKRAEQECTTAGGRVYTREDIDRTGSADIKDALRRLDPSIF